MKLISIQIIGLLVILILVSSCSINRKAKPIKSTVDEQVVFEGIVQFNDINYSYEPYLQSDSSRTTGSIKGIIMDDYDTFSLPYVNVAVIKNEETVSETLTDFDGAFVIENISEAVYDLSISYIGFKSIRISDVSIKNEMFLNIDTIHLLEDNLFIEKPIIYIYPEETQNIEVKLNYNGKLTHTYPKYSNGWEVTAQPNGTMFDVEGKEYYALYWEGVPNNNYSIDEGNVIAGSETIAFLEDALDKLGLNRKEANEFIIYWLPKLESNPYNLIHFSTIEYEEMAELIIKPKPETLIRVMMVFKPFDKQITTKPQNLDKLAKKRKGFTVVEWGGTELPKWHDLDLN